MEILNPALVKQQKLTPATVTLLENLHIAMIKHKHTPLKDIPDIKAYVDHIREIEFAMQRLWGFPEDPSYHTHWYDDPKCSCPSMDNREMQGINRSIINSACKLHGDTTKPKEEQHEDN